MGVDLSPTADPAAEVNAKEDLAGYESERQTLKVCPPHPEEGASTCVSEKHIRRVAPVSKDGAASWFETPRTSLRNRGRLKVAAPHHEAERDRACIKLTGISLLSALR
jgi:hypothetical protein